MSDPEVKMTIKTLARKGVANREIARTLGLNEATVRYHRKRMDKHTPDGRARQKRKALEVADAIEYWREQMGGFANTAQLHEWLVAEHHYRGSLRSVQRYLADHYPPPKRRTRRRVETPPGAQAQADWAHYPKVMIEGGEADLSLFHMTLSYSRMATRIWSRSQQQCSWISAHNHAFTRLGGVPATVRIDNSKTAVVRGAGPWGVLNETYRRYAQTMRFHIDLCLPREPRAKGKVERDVRTGRGEFNPYTHHWDSLEDLQAASDAHHRKRLADRRCPATGTPVPEAYAEELPFLSPIPATLPEPFDNLATRKVGTDCMVSFEARQYSVPFCHVGERVEVRGCAATVQVFRNAALIAEHPRHSDCRVVINPAHYDGEASNTHVPPPPLGRLGRILDQLGELPVEQRPMDLYAAIAEGLER